MSTLIAHNHVHAESYSIPRVIFELKCLEEIHADQTVRSAIAVNKGQSSDKAWKAWMDELYGPIED